MGAVDQAVGEVLNYYLEEHPKEAKAIVDKVILAATARHAARKAREMVQRKSPMSGGGLPGKLADCSDKDPQKCELFLVEETLPAVQLSKAVTVHFRLFFHYAVRF